MRLTAVEAMCYKDTQAQMIRSSEPDMRAFDRRRKPESGLFRSGRRWSLSLNPGSLADFRAWVFYLKTAACRVVLLSAVLAGAAAAGDAAVLVIDNFDAGREQNLLGGKMGTWQADPTDPRQWCNMSFSDEERFGSAGKSLYLDYSVDSPKPAYNGLWMKLNNIDARPFDRLVVFVKGDSEIGYPSAVLIEVKNAREVGRSAITPVNNKWQKVTIPFGSFRGITDWSSLTELVLVFSDKDIDARTGGVFFDELCLSDGDFVPQERRAPVQPAVLSARTNSGQSLSLLAVEAQQEGLEVRQEQEAVVITLHINFDVNSSAVRSAEAAKIAQVAGILMKHGATRVRVEGFTDSTGSDALNLKLSAARARSVSRSLREAGVSEGRLFSVGRGKEHPVDTNKTPEGRARNRRVEFVIEDQEL